MTGGETHDISDQRLRAMLDPGSPAEQPDPAEIAAMARELLVRRAATAVRARAIADAILSAPMSTLLPMTVEEALANDGWDLDEVQRFIELAIAASLAGGK
jgi:hypothetical protein